MGYGGQKYVVGGIIIRKAVGWTQLGQTMSPDVNYKRAAYGARNLAYMRHKLPTLMVPLCCIVDCNGERYECHSMPSVTINTLVYGTDTDSLVFKHAPIANSIVSEIEKLCNLKEHTVFEIASANHLLSSLPYDVQIHKVDEHFWLLNAYRLFPDEYKQ
jgi:hypothetical protein